MLELVLGIAPRSVQDVGPDRGDEEEHGDHRRGQIQPCRPGAEFDEDRDQRGRERIEQRRPVRDVDVGVSSVIFGHHDLPVLPHAEAKRQQKDQSGRQQSDLGIDSEDAAHRSLEFNCASGEATTVGSMRFAFKTSPQDTTWADMLAVWQAADDIDIYESGWTFDHFYPIFGNSSGPCLEGWTTLTALAQATRRLRLGTLVTGIHYRHPAVLANMAAALDIISNGRLELGIGAGWNEEESGAYGIELGTIRERFDRFEEACEVLTSLLSQQTTDFDGKFYQLKGARNEPKGPQRPHPPICIGGSGEKRTLPITARYAQHWNFAGGPPELFAQKRDVLAARCSDIGRDPKEITMSAHLRLAPDRNYGQVIEDAAALAAEGLDLGIVYIAPPHDPAVLEPLAEAIRESGLIS